MIDEPALRRSLAEAGAKNVRARFSSEPGIDFVAKRLRASRSRREGGMSARRPKGDAARARFARAARQGGGAVAARSSSGGATTTRKRVRPPSTGFSLTARRHDLPLALAVIPKGATTALAERLRTEPRVAVLQHGWQHKNHAAEGEKKIELGGERPTAEVLDELRRGCERLQTLFPEKFLPVLVPPWNRIADAVRDRRG